MVLVKALGGQGGFHRLRLPVIERLGCRSIQVIAEGLSIWMRGGRLDATRV